MNQTKIAGTGVALVTPFNPDLSIDFNALDKIINHIIAGGADFIVVLGTTGESALLTLEERREIIAFVKEKTAGRIPLVLGYGGICTSMMASGFNSYDLSGIDALLVVTPYYVKPSQKGLIEHYKTLADASPLPIIMYNVPGRTGINMEPDTTLTLSEHPNIIGIKEASGKLFQIEEILMRKSKDFYLYSGDDALTYHLMNVGAEGVISVMANAFPAQTARIVDRAPDGGTTVQSKEWHTDLKVITKAVFADGNPSGIIYLMSAMGFCKNILRLPLVPVSDTTAKTIDSELRRITGD